ncbi:MAG: Flp pilus assembly complex ATPase component TadA [Akkermansiaceae bacterium]|nr:Flp pilus assembly complex ATPase component TadA [Armatimonadota bacterium]
MENDLLPMEEAAHVLGISKPTLYRLVSQGAVHGLKAGKQWRFRREDLNAYLEQIPTPVPPAPPGIIATEIAFFAGELQHIRQEPPDDSGSSGDVNSLFDLLIRNALATGASDIHLEPAAGGLRLRYRVDGLLHIIRQMPAALRESLIATIKEHAQMNPTERRQPQDGRIRYDFGAKEFELRVSCIPTVDGETVVARITDRSQVLIGLDRLGLSPEDRARLDDWRQQPNGLVVVTGPAGSGRSTLIYSLLLAANGPGKKLLTVEDPVELRLDGVSQIPVGRRAGLSFAQGLRAALRQDPDILYVGEVPDADTARLIHEAASLGSLAMAALPAGRAADVPMWMIDRGVEPFLVSSYLAGVVTVRLLRRVCTECREPVPVSAGTPAFEHLCQLSADGGFVVSEGTVFYRGRGCSTCRGSGYKGRTGLFELMPFSPELGSAVLGGAAPDEIEAIAVAAGMKTLLADGMRKAAEGVTTLDEIMRVVTVA